MAEKTKVTIAILVAVIVVLASIVAYTFLVRPKISGYVSLGYNDAIADIAQRAVQCQQQPIILPVGQDEQGNTQVRYLVAIECFPDRFPELFEENQSTGTS